VRLLVLGGTKFLGRAVAEAAQARGHDVTLFTRGKTNPWLFPEAEHLAGDRDGELAALEGRSWDAVVDTCGYVPRVVRASAELLAPAVDHYTFVSTGSVYPDDSEPGYEESAPVQTLEEPDTENVTAHYGPLKAACERVVDEAMQGRALHVRAGLIVGPHDPTGRFTYWVHRIARGGEVLAPEPRDQPVQFIDVRDLAGWMISASERRLAGTFNATGPEDRLTLEELLAAIRETTGGGAQFRWVGERFLVDRGVEPWSELPLWLAPEAHPEYAAVLTMGIGRALSEGLTFRPLEETVRGTLELARTTSDAGLETARERELLDAWLSSGRDEDRGPRAAG
jgi:2'-hydroxyisoflavone reductase